MAGVYTVTVTDNNLCTATTTATITQPVSNFFNAPAIQNVSCFGGNNGIIIITASGGAGGFAYAWTSGSNSDTASDLSANVPYTVTATDANGCTSDTTISITSPTAESISLTIVDVSCFGNPNGAITAATTGGTPGYNYVWNNMVTDSFNSGLVAGAYTLTVTDNAGCTATAAAAVAQPGLLAGSTSVVDVLCFGGSTGAVDLFVTGGTLPDTYLWSNAAQSKNINNVVAGTYTVTITDSHLCTATATGVVTQPVAPLALAVLVTDAACYGGNNGAIGLTVTGGTIPYSYNWGSGIVTQNLASIPAGNYAVTVTDSAGCMDSISTAITSPPAIQFNSPVLTEVNCYGANNGSIFVTASGGVGGFTYAWSNGDTIDTATALLAYTPYTVTATDTNLCTAATTFTLTSPTQLVVSAVETDDKCFGNSNGTASASASGGVSPYAYLWSNGQAIANINGLAYGGYAVTATDANGCTASTATAIGQPARLNVVIDSVVGPTCTYNTNGYIVASGNGGTLPYNYNLALNNSGVGTNSTGEFYNLSEGSFTVTLTDSNGCSAGTSGKS